MTDPKSNRSSQSMDEIPAPQSDLDGYPPLLLAFGPATHDYEAEGSDDAEAYIVGYN
jgi:hypothetical protein